MAAPLISIIIVCRNPGRNLPAALDSVWNQPGLDFEILVIDGESTDGSRAWLEAHRNRLGWFVSEPDRGVYDAMNKGLAAAKGTWVIFLGADDRLEKGVLASVESCLAQTVAGVVAGEARYDDGRVYRFSGTSGAIRRNFLHHQATFYRRALFEAHGGFLPDLRIMADYELNLRLMQAGISFQLMPLRVATCGTGGLSDGGSWIVYREEIRVRHRYFPVWRCWGWDALSVVRYFRKKIVRIFARPERRD